MGLWVILGLLSLTSALGVLVGAGALRLSFPALLRGIEQALECIGLGCGFLILNLAIGILGVLALRSVTATFISIYYVNDLALVAVSLLQGILFFCWRAASRVRGGEGYDE